MISNDEDEIDIKALLRMINGLARAFSSSVARLNEVETKLVRRDHALAKVESELETERQIVADLQDKVNAIPSS